MNQTMNQTMNQMMNQMMNPKIINKEKIKERVDLIKVAWSSGTRQELLAQPEFL